MATELWSCPRALQQRYLCALSSSWYVRQEQCQPRLPSSGQERVCLGDFTKCFFPLPTLSQNFLVPQHALFSVHTYIHTHMFPQSLYLLCYLAYKTLNQGSLSARSIQRPAPLSMPSFAFHSGWCEAVIIYLSFCSPFSLPEPQSSLQCLISKTQEIELM